MVRVAWLGVLHAAVAPDWAQRGCNSIEDGELRILLASLAIRAVCLILGGFAVKGAWEVGTGWRVD